MSHLLDYKRKHFLEQKAEYEEKIEDYEYTLDGASDDVFVGAMERFNTQGRHPRVSLDHALLSL